MDLDKRYEKLLMQFRTAKTDADKYKVIVAISRFANKFKYAKAFYFFGECHSTGTILEKSSFQAFTCYSEAAKLGFIPAYVKCGMLWEEICYRDPSKQNSSFDEKEYKQSAISDYYQAAKRKNPQAMYRLAQIYLTRGHYNLEKAQRWLKRAIGLGYKDAEESLEWVQRNSDLFDKTGDAKKAVIDKRTGDKVGCQIIDENDQPVTVIYNCSCYPEVTCMLGSDGRHYKDHFNRKSCTDTNSCMGNTDDSMELDIRDIKVRADAGFYASNWRYVTEC